VLTSNQKIYQIFKEKYILSQVLPEYLSKWATERVQADGVSCIPNVEIHDCRMNKGQMSLTLTDGSSVSLKQSNNIFDFNQILSLSL
jgi:programmed cell death 8 (apoptosis-inducing factor)